MAFNISNPYQEQLGQLPQRGTDARRALDTIYKNLYGTVPGLQKRLRGIDTHTRTAIMNLATQSRAASAAQRQAGIADILGIAHQSSGTVDEAEQAFLSNLATRKQGQYAAASSSGLHARGKYQDAIGHMDQQFIRELKASAVREKQARQGELEQNLLNYGIGLRTNAALFDAQMQQLNQTQGFINQGLQGASQGPGGGGVQQSNGSYSVGQASGLSAAEAWIITHESGGNPMAQNPHSSAFGIGQFLDSTWRTYAARFGYPFHDPNPQHQLQMFRAYIRDRYGTAENAQRFWQANGWY